MSRKSLHRQNPHFFYFHLFYPPDASQSRYRKTTFPNLAEIGLTTNGLIYPKVVRPEMGKSDGTLTWALPFIDWFLPLCY
jgi:hypothetical protein